MSQKKKKKNQCQERVGIFPGFAMVPAWLALDTSCHFNLPNGDDAVITIPTAQMRKLRPRPGKLPARGHGQISGEANVRASWLRRPCGGYLQASDIHPQGGVGPVLGTLHRPPVCEWGGRGHCPQPRSEGEVGPSRCYHLLRSPDLLPPPPQHPGRRLEPLGSQPWT